MIALGRISTNVFCKDVEKEFRQIMYIFGFCQVVSVITEGLPQVFGTNLVNGQVSRSFHYCTYFRHFVKPFITSYSLGALDTAITGVTSAHIRDP